MGRYLLRRILQMIPVVLGTTLFGVRPGVRVAGRPG